MASSGFFLSKDNSRYETYNGKLLAIIEAFKTWKQYLKDFQYEVFMLTNYNNL